MIRNYAYLSGASLLVIAVALTPLLLLAPPVLASGTPCYSPGSREPEEELVTCASQCDYGTYCRYNYETLTYTYTICSVGGTGSEQQCEEVEVVVEERTRCIKDATKECDSPPWPPGCVSGGCVENSNEYQCKVDPNRTTLIVKEDKLLPYETFQSCD